MKIILSRKGFDASAGGVASPLFPDGALLSLPIPDQKGTVTYADLSWGEHQLGDLVEALTHGRIDRQTRTHLDPDLYATICARPPAWRPLFGQDGAAQSHLTNQGVGVGDLFLFFGWFRAVALVRGHYRFVKNAPDLHLLYGWLQVGAMLTGAQLAAEAPAWAASHPHCIGGRGVRNTVYIASEQLTLDGHITALPGADYCPTYRDNRCLTAPGRLRTHWRLPRWFYPHAEKPPLSYHTDRTRWACDDNYAYLRSAMRGQEFVLDTQDYPEALAWVTSLLHQPKGVN
ncbi:MAG: hypothetical protein DYG89_18370 [Caldilinea sp. CFX5]|nr:hypothetical protein [Caldilinea sp. CFX5]